MNDTSRVDCLIALLGPKSQYVSVGVVVRPASTVRRYFFKWSRDGHRLALEFDATSKELSENDDPVSCMIACVAGIEHFRSKHEPVMDVEFTLLEGRKLSDGWTLGFFYAAFRAFAKASGYWPEGYTDDMDNHGWHVVSGEAMLPLA
jgi:hypothetical protein